MMAAADNAVDLLERIEGRGLSLAWELEIRSSHPGNVQGQAVTSQAYNCSSDGMVRSETGDGTLGVENV